MTTKDENVSLTQRLRDARHDDHEKSDKLVNFKMAMVVTSTKPCYAEAISLFWPIYRELEILIEKHKDHPHIGKIYPLLPYQKANGTGGKGHVVVAGPQREGSELLKARRLRTEDGKEIFSPPELQAYIDHLRKLSDEQPILLIPYIYSMHSAIMAGGVAIKRMVKHSFSLKTDEGVDMFGISLEGSKYAEGFSR